MNDSGASRDCGSIDVSIVLPRLRDLALIRLEYSSVECRVPVLLDFCVIYSHVKNIMIVIDIPDQCHV